MNTRTWIVGLICCLGVLLSAGSPVAGQVTYPPRVGDRDFVADEAKLLSSEDKASVRSTSEQLLESKGIPIIVVTINSMADYGAGGWNIERYAMNLFDEWGIGHSGGRNGGILLLVSKNDRKVRIELGGTWSHDRDTDAASIINTIIVPRFKNKQFSEGIRMGVEALASQLGGAHAAAASQANPAGSAMQSVPGMTRGSASSSPLHSTGLSKLLGPMACLVVPIIFIVVISIISRVGRGLGGGMMGGGSGGYGPMGWGSGGGGGFMSGAILGGLLGNAWGSRHSGSSWGRGGSSGGGFSSGSFGGGGGSFGGGFSGGGGATGSW